MTPDKLDCRSAASYSPAVPACLGRLEKSLHKYFDYDEVCGLIKGVFTFLLLATVVWTGSGTSGIGDKYISAINRCEDVAHADIDCGKAGDNGKKISMSVKVRLQ